MHKRFSILVMLWLGFLWAAAPALACAPMPDRDCCPTGTHTPCGADQSGVDLRAVAALCCVTAPVASPAAIADESRVSGVQHDADPHASAALLAWFATLEPPEREPPPLPPDASGLRADASLTYLHTLRLRL